MLKRCAALLITLMVLLSLFSTAFAAATPYPSYTYNYWGDPVPAPHAYLPSHIVDGRSLGVGTLNTPMDLFVTQDRRIFIADTGNNRIIVTDAEWNVLQIIAQFSNNGEADTFNNPQGVFVTAHNEIYVADTNNGRIVHLDPEGKFIRVLGAPVSDIISEDLVYRPFQLVLDRAQRLYVLAHGVNRGIIELDSEGNFRGFLGAARVTPSMVDYFWKLIATEAQRERLELFVPTEYNNITIDNDGFIYVTTSALNRWDIQAAINSRSTDDRVAPIRKLNPMGTDVLRRRGFHPPVGDVRFPWLGSEQGPSQLVDVHVGEYEIYSVLDRRRGRIFTYDSDSNLLFIFGGNGNRLGNFRSAVALSKIDNNFIVLDAVFAQITVFEPTEYGSLILSAVSLHHKGYVNESAAQWAEVLRLNANSDLAYIGMGKAYMRQDNFAAAMRSFRLGNKRVYYTRAFQFYRKEVIGQNFGWLMSGLAAMIIGFKIRKYRKNKYAPKEVD